MTSSRDAAFVLGLLLTAVGAGTFHLGAGLIAAGAILLFVTLRRAPHGPAR